MSKRQERFTVDTHLFRELGELLVGRDSTALIELIKNSYDADATEVIVHGSNLDEPEKGIIIVSDDGTGMTPEEFRRGFLRVASRLKVDGARISKRFERRLTGEKGIGRLAAHKLARVLEVESTPWSAESTDAVESIEATIDWDRIEEFETLSEIEGTDAIALTTTNSPHVADSGTRLRLSNLRRKWTPTERARFFAEVQSFDPPDALTRPLGSSLVRRELLFDAPLVRHARSQSPAFQVRLEGEFEAGDEYWRLMEQQASWVVEISCRPRSDRVNYAIAPTKSFVADYPNAEPIRESVDHPAPGEGPFFDARFFLRVGALRGSNDQKTWASSASGIRVYMEGFRVLPYGEAQNDWLGLDADYTRRSRNLSSFKRFDLEPPGDKDWGLVHLPNNNFFGGVFLVHKNAGGLRALVNREGFVPEPSYYHLVSLVRLGVDLCTRANAAARYEERQQRKSQRRSRTTEPASPTSELRASLQRAEKQLSRIQETARTKGQPAVAEDAIGEVIETVRNSTDRAAEVIEEQSLLRVLASVGTQMASFVHELNTLLAASKAVEESLTRLAAEAPHGQKGKLRQVAAAVGELRRGIEREASYLTDILAPDARRRRSRQRLARSFDSAARLVAPQAQRRAIEIENRIPSHLKSPAMFAAELIAVLANLITNAVKAAGDDGKVRATADEGEGGSITLLIENTGVSVNVAKAERLFRPFESSTTAVSPLLGQGLGLGLPIARRVLGDYGAEIRFVSPSTSFSTAVAVTFPA